MPRLQTATLPAASCGVQMASRSTAAVAACRHAAVAGVAIFLWHLLFCWWQRRQRARLHARERAASKAASKPAAVGDEAAARPAKAACILAHVAAAGPKTVAASPFTAASSAAASSPFAEAAFQASLMASFQAPAPAPCSSSPFAAFAGSAFSACGSSRDSLEPQAQQKQLPGGLLDELAASVGACPTPPPHCAARRVEDLVDSDAPSPSEPALSDSLRTPSGCLFAWAEADAVADAALPFPALDHGVALSAPTLAPAALPPQLHRAVVPPTCVTMLCNPDGSPQQLGSGARCGCCWTALRRSCACLLVPVRACGPGTCQLAVRSSAHLPAGL